MRRRLAFLLMALASLPIFSAPTLVDSYDYAGRVPASGSFCSTAPTNIFCLDLDTNGGAAASPETCANNKPLHGTDGADTTVGSIDCQSTTSPLDGSYDITATNNNSQDSATWSDDFSSASDLQITFLLNVVSDDNDAAAYSLMNFFAGATDKFEIKINPSNNALFVASTVNMQSGTAIIANNTIYKVCVKVQTDATPNAQIWVDAAGGTYCVGAVDHGGETATGNSDPGTITSVVIHPECWQSVNTDQCVARIDDVVISEITY